MRLLAKPTPSAPTHVSLVQRHSRATYDRLMSDGFDASYMVTTTSARLLRAQPKKAGRATIFVDRGSRSVLLSTPSLRPPRYCVIQITLLYLR